MALGSLDVERLLVVFGALTDMEWGQLGPDMQVDVLRQQDGDADSRLLYLAEAWRRGERGINLLQGAYQTKRPTSPLWERWRPVAGLAAVWAGLAFLGIIAQGIYASYRADELEASSEALYREIFPRDQRITNVRRQMQARLGDRGDDAGIGFLDQLGVLGAELTPGTSVMSLSYTEEREELAADLMIPGYEELDRLKQSLGTKGLAVDITSAEQQERGVRARLRISPQGGGQGA
jgi:general secretion pathway protein L